MLGRVANVRHIFGKRHDALFGLIVDHLDHVAFAVIERAFELRDLGIVLWYRRVLSIYGNGPHKKKRQGKQFSSNR
jgi:hypothetical protein